MPIPEPPELPGDDELVDGPDGQENDRKDPPRPD